MPDGERKGAAGVKGCTEGLKRGVFTAPQSKRGMTAAVVELNALPNAIGPSSQDQNLGLVCRQRLALAIIGAVHVGSGRLKLSSTGIHALVAGLNLQFLSLGPNLLLPHSCQAESVPQERLAISAW